MEQIFPGLYLIHHPQAGKPTQFTFLIKRDAGNFLFATKANIISFLEAIHAEGGVSALLLGDRHHVDHNTLALSHHFEVELTCSEIEAKVVRRQGIEIGNPLEFKRQKFAEDLEIIPTPGHTAGAFSYLWSSDNGKYLFLGDVLVPVDGEWKFWVTRAGRQSMIQSMELLQLLDFNYIVVNSFACTEFPCIAVTPEEKVEIFTNVVQELRKS